MQNAEIHIVSFDNPFPPVYGGVIDVFYKVKALHAIGFKIYLHCFVEDLASDVSGLDEFTEKVFLYKKKKNPLYLFSQYPFSVRSRFDNKLVKNLNTNQAPILFEGLQSTYILNVNHFKRRKIYLRLHNIEHFYYDGLAQSETNIFKKILFKIESLKYYNYLNILKKFDKVYTLSFGENTEISKMIKRVEYIPVFHGNKQITSKDGRGEYAFYNGDLRISDNRKAVDFFIEVFKKIPDYQLVIASGIEQDWVESKIQSASNIQFVKIEHQQHLSDLLRDAHINLMISFQESGTKLKIINSLFQGRHCVCNEKMIDDKEVLGFCHIAKTEKDFIEKINQLKDYPFLMDSKRAKVLERRYNDLENAKKMFTDDDKVRSVRS
ncbi:glycosyltransferase family 4 protein [Flavobacterium amniphilum]|uniref:glycosyltransferase n=1 Tax=Flavobacterium amniphilum TaxID=1834035 RepID=UPI00202A8C75|nr:glycosyltransferase [Flavobacterium amniphilum]MCL9805618.1 glycosyltransferase family 4 protein [Flavobacterium amniphilum]